MMFIYRELYYLAREKPTEGTEELRWQERMSLVDGTAEVIIGKTGTAHGHGKWPLKTGLHASPISLKTTICQSVMTDLVALTDCAQVTVDLAALGEIMKPCAINWHGEAPLL